MIEKLYSHPELKNCPINSTFKIVGQKWTVLILREMFRNQTHFNHILQNIDGLTPRVLAQRMKTLQILGIVELFLNPQFILNIDLPIREELLSQYY
jgi:DNA-binding HxlR family transcriptional regulator